MRQLNSLHLGGATAGGRKPPTYFISTKIIMDNPMKLLLQSLFILLLLSMQPLSASQSPEAGNMPKGLWQAFSEARHVVEENKDAQDGYAYRAYNPKNSYSIRYGEQGLKLSKADWTFAMTLKAYGQEQNLKPVQKASLSTEGNKVTYERGSVSEWYVNNSGGLEQGFTLKQPEGYEPRKRLILTLDFSGDLSPKWKNDGQSIAFYKGSQLAFDYEKLKAFDANGKTLAANMVLVENKLQILVDAKDAQWPVTVDPVFASEQKVVASLPDAAAGDQFGYSVAMDGNTAIIGAPYDDDGGADVGSTYVFIYLGSGWISQGKLQPAVVTGVQRFGSSVAVSGDTVIVGAPFSDIGFTNKGTAYVFTRSGSSWSQAAILTASNPAANINFGTSVAVSGNSAVVGGPGLNVGYFFENGGTWADMSETVYFTNGEAGSNFGKSVAMSGSRALVGAPNSASGGSHRGLVHALEHDGSNWIPVGGALSASDAADYDLFGTSVALDSDTALIGAPGLANGNAAYVFFDSTGGWTQTQILTATGGSATGDNFGYSVALNLPFAVIGAWGDSDDGPQSGSAYVFESQLIVGLTQVAKLTASDAAIEDYFGEAVAIAGDTVLVGARGDDDGGSYSGSVYTFEKPIAGWADGHESDKLVAVTPTSALAWFGTSVAIDKDTALIGAPGDQVNGIRPGSAYVFVHSDDRWEFQDKLIANDGIGFDYFGDAVAVEGNTALIGAPYCDDNGANSGAAYVFTRSGVSWSQHSKLLKPGGAQLELFGASIAIDGDTAVIGAPGTETVTGAVDIFYRNDFDVWIFGGEVSDAASGDEFGYSVALIEDTMILVGSPGDVSEQGSFRIYDFDGAYWNLESTHIGYATSSEDRLGHAVAVNETTMLISAPRDDTFGTNTGKVLAFTFDVPGDPFAGRSYVTLTASDATAYNEFGDSVAVDGNTVVVGSATEPQGSSRSGFSYIFTRSGSAWYELAIISPSDGQPGDEFGHSVALSGDTVLTGSPGDDDGAGGAGSAYMNRYECGFAGPVVANRWTMFGLPCAPDADADTVGELFGDTLDVNDYYYRWVVYSRDHITDMYKRLRPTDAVEQGVGYWLMSLDDSYWDATGSLTEYPITLPGGCSDPAGCKLIPLTSPDSPASDRYNLVGYPGNTTINWAGVRFIVDGDEYTPEQAEQLGYVSKNMWKYNGNGYDVYDTSTPGMEGELNSHEGIWVKLLGGSATLGVDLLIPANSIISEPPGPPMSMLEQDTASDSNDWLSRIVDFFIPTAHAGKPTWEQEWYLRLIAESPSEGLRDRGNVLGQLQDSVAGYDSHDLIELAPFSTPYLTIVFPHDDWDDQSGNYSSNYHEAFDYYAEDQWIFQVKSDNPYRDINLYWDGVNLLEGIWSQDTGKRTFSKSKQADGGALLQRMWLEDMDTGERIEAVTEDPFTGAISRQSHQFNMNGLNIRTFRWVLDSHNGKAPKPPKVPKVKTSKKATEFKTPPGLDRIDQQPPKVGHN